MSLVRLSWYSLPHVRASVSLSSSESVTSLLPLPITRPPFSSNQRSVSSSTRAAFSSTWHRSQYPRIWISMFRSFSRMSSWISRSSSKSTSSGSFSRPLAQSSSAVMKASNSSSSESSALLDTAKIQVSSSSSGTATVDPSMCPTSIALPHCAFCFSFFFGVRSAFIFSHFSFNFLYSSVLWNALRSFFLCPQRQQWSQ